MAIQVNNSNIVALTTVMFNAAPGANNLDAFDNYGSLEQLAGDLAATDTFNNQFDGLETQEEKINLVLTQNLGLEQGSDAYQEAMSFFNARLDAGASAGEVLIEAGNYLLGDNVSENFQPAAQLLKNKIEVGTYYSQDHSADSLDELQSVYANVSTEQSSVDEAKAAIDSMPADQTPSGGPGEVFTLTTGTDVLTGTDGDDTFLAPKEDDTDTMNNFDQIDGGAGRDTLRVEGDQEITGDISNVEVVRVEDDAAATYDVTAVSGFGRTVVCKY